MNDQVDPEYDADMVFFRLKEALSEYIFTSCIRGEDCQCLERHLQPDPFVFSAMNFMKDLTDREKEDE